MKKNILLLFTVLLCISIAYNVVHCESSGAADAWEDEFEVM